MLPATKAQFVAYLGGGRGVPGIAHSDGSAGSSQSAALQYGRICNA